MDNKQIISSGQENSNNKYPPISKAEYTKQVALTTLFHIIIMPFFFYIGAFAAIYDGPKDNIFIIIFGILLFYVFIIGPIISYVQTLRRLSRQYRQPSQAEIERKRPYEIAVGIIIVLSLIIVVIMNIAG